MWVARDHVHTKDLPAFTPPPLLILIQGQYKQIVTFVFSLLTDPGKTIKVLEQVEEFAQEHGISSSPLKSVIKNFVLIPSGREVQHNKFNFDYLFCFSIAALKNNLTSEQIQADFTALGLSAEKADYFRAQWRDNQASLSKSALAQTLMVNQLVNMEWKFGVTASSSEVNKLGSTFLQLKLVINKGNKVENMYMELTLPQFYSFLHEMEKAKASLEYFN
ncbi:hypothetical protein CAPTEDRAFT_226635 [Capitella teleta]|uniref:COMM domain-containing protein n=1 Tax=Capitella teleta TaxID=283909 RepID=R7TAY0_CAPTE|nr:hypothetical protein CAPTEDRAFT_226635 [Capitella teleta]|eukprot:ELT88652.1 hypothetical protein CAPTEDRAFT_226635 [Capitella teleta]